MPMKTDAFASILLLEDEELVRLSLAEELADAGLTVHDARSVEEARLIFSAHPEIGIVVTDLTIKGDEGGLEFCDFVQAARPDCRIVIGSGRHLPPNRVPGALLLMKPFDATDLLRLLGA